MSAARLAVATVRAGVVAVALAAGYVIGVREADRDRARFVVTLDEWFGDVLVDDGQTIVRGAE